MPKVLSRQRLRAIEALRELVEGAEAPTPEECRDWVERWAHALIDDHGPRAQPLTVEDETYPSLGAAAKALGVTRRAIEKSKLRGTIERDVKLWRLGLRATRPYWIEIDGAVYDDIKTAAWDNDVHVSTIYGWLDSGRAKKVYPEFMEREMQP